MMRQEPALLLKIFIDDMSEVYRNSDIVISRSGAMSVSEICSAQKAFYTVTVTMVC